MKSVKLNVLLRFVGLLLLTPITTLSFAQIKNLGPNKITISAPTNPNFGGYLESVPSDYATSGKNYPLLIFTMGNGTGGTGSQSDLDRLLGTGGGYIQDQIRDINDPSNPAIAHFTPAWPTTFTVGGQDFQFIVIVPQFNYNYFNTFPVPSDLNDVIDYAISHYRIDRTRIYLTGNSNGGRLTWDYPGTSSAYANRIAAITPFSSVTFPTLEKATRIKNANIAVWAFHNADDASVPPYFTTDFVKLINQDPPPAIPAKLTTPPGTGHDSWQGPYRRTYTEGGKNIFEWMLQYKRTLTNANAGLDQDITLPSNTASLSGSGTAANGSAAVSYSWSKVMGPAGGTLSSPTAQNPTVSGLVEGYYVYRLTITGSGGSTSTDDVAITVYPQRYEAESPSSSTSTSTGSTTDNGAPAGVLLMDAVGDVANYTINVPERNFYTLRLRTSSNQPSPSGLWADGGSTIKVSINGNPVGNIFVPNSGTLDNFATGFLENILMQAGPNVLTLETTRTGSAGSTAINWAQFLSSAAAAASVVTPVNFTLFNSNCADGAVNLTWKTAGESNTKEFSVEKSANGADWTSIATIKANGTIATSQSYSYRDNGGNTSYYRIVGVDFDGKKTQTSIIKSSCSEKLAFTVFPNPVTDKTVVDISLDKATKFKIVVLDSRGAAVKQQITNLPKGNSQVTLYLNGLPNGTYTLNAIWDNEVRSVKLIKK